MDQILISQSFIKALEEGKCQLRAHAIYIEGMRTEPTGAMELGNYFETLVYGGTETGERTEPERNLRTNELKAPYERVKTHAARWNSEYKKKYNIQVVEPRVHLYADVEGHPGFRLRARLDLTVSLDDPINFQASPHIPLAILDTKITGSLKSTFGDYAWGAPAKMDHLQADFYSFLHLLTTGQRIPFYYLVMETGPEVGHMLMLKAVSDQDLRNVKTRIRVAIATIQHNFRLYGNEWPTTPNAENCRKCPLASTCSQYPYGITIKRIPSSEG